MIFPFQCAQYLSIAVLGWNLILVDAGSGYDPVVNFCRRVGHASTYKNQKVYINGGLETFADYGSNGKINQNTITSGFNLNLLSINLTADWGSTVSVPINQDPKHKSGTVTGYTTPPNFEYGALYSGSANSTKLYSFGGTTNGYNTSFHDFFTAPDTSHPLWIYDSKTDLWTTVDTSQQGITIPSRGASAEAPNLGLGFYIGGQIDNGTANTTSSLTTPVALSGMIVINTTSGNLYNSSIPAAAVNNRQGGSAVYTNTFGTSGVLLAIGGQSAGQLLSMDQIAIFDVSTINQKQPTVNSDTVNTWYSVSATGDIPSPRTDFCTVVASAQDGSSTNIYMYGGKSSSEIFDDVYVLSLPSFIWTNVYSGTSGRWGMTCQLVSPRQMILIGGMDSNNNTDNCDWLTQGLATLDLSTVSGRQGWNSSAYQHNVPQYEVPPDVVSAIGGNVNGSATKTAPANGWSTSGLSTLFTVKAVKTSTASSSSPSSSSSSSSSSSDTSGGSSSDNSAKSTPGLSTGAKAGIAVGAVVLAIICLLVALFVLGKSKKNKRASQVAQTTMADNQHELEDKDRYQLEDDQTASSSKVELMANGGLQGYHSSAEKDGHAIHEAPWNQHRNGSGNSVEKGIEHKYEPVELA